MTQREETETQGTAHRQLGSYKDQGMPSLCPPSSPRAKRELGHALLLLSQHRSGCGTPSSH